METEVITKFKIHKPANEVFNAIVDPVKIGNFWFTSSSERWEEGKSVILRYDEYEAECMIKVSEVEVNKKIVFSWGSETEEETVVAITLKKYDDATTLIEVNESGFNVDDPELVNKMLGQKGGWVYMLTCLKAYLENDNSELRASLIH